MGRWFGLWLSEEIAQLKAFRDTLHPNGKAYKDISELIEKLEADETSEIKDKDDE